MTVCFSLLRRVLAEGPFVDTAFEHRGVHYLGCTIQSKQRCSTVGGHILHENEAFRWT